MKNLLRYAGGMLVDLVGGMVLLIVGVTAILAFLWAGDMLWRAAGF